MKQLSVFAGYLFTLTTDGIMSVTNTETNVVSAPSAKGEFKILVDSTPKKITVDELKANTNWKEVSTAPAAPETAPAAPETKPVITAESLQAEIDKAATENETAQKNLESATDENRETLTGIANEAKDALDAANEALKTFHRNEKIAAIKASVKETATANATALQPHLDAANTAKKAMQDAMMDDAVTLETLAALRTALRTANEAVEKFEPIINPNIAEIDSNIDRLTDIIEAAKDELSEYKKLKAGATGKKVSESTATGERQEFPDFTWEMGEKCRQMKADGKTADETMAAVNCSYGSYQRSIGKAKDGNKPYHPVYESKPTQVEIPSKKA
jgi:hypothetical protein